MDLLLAHSYYLSEDAAERAVMKPYPPLGLLYISSYLKARGYEVEVFDSTFRTRREFFELVDARRPRVVGIYANLITRASALAMAAHARARGAWVVLGGPEPANYPAEYLSHGADVVVVGEGEATLEELLPRLAAGRDDAVDSEFPDLRDVAGLIYRDASGELVHNPPRPGIQDLDAQPFPDRAAIDMGAYLETWRRHHGMGSVSLITARGCPYKCTWCSHAVFGYTHRRRSPENVADEVEQIVARYRPEMLWYADDVFTIHHRWLFGYAAELERRGLRLPFETISREDRLNDQVIATLAAMGCFRLWIGAESGSQRVLDAMQRRTDAARVRELVGKLQRAGIEAGLFVMLGYDGEDWSDLQATASHLKAANPDRFLTTLAYPIKGTPYYEQVRDRIIPLKPWAEGSDRDLTVRGRHSRRFYAYANRWLVNEVALAKERRGVNGGRNVLRLAKRFASAKLGRLGMYWTRQEVETGA